MKRRGFLIGIAGALAAPAIVRAESLMKLATLRSGFVTWEAFEDRLYLNDLVYQIEPSDTPIFDYMMKLQLVRTGISRRLTQVLLDDINDPADGQA